MDSLGILTEVSSEIPPRVLSRFPSGILSNIPSGFPSGVLADPFVIPPKVHSGPSDVPNGNPPGLYYGLFSRSFFTESLLD